MLVVGALGVVGPLFVGYAIDNGMTPGTTTSRVVIAVRGGRTSSLAVAVAYAQRGQVHVTGRLAARVMHDLRIRVFTHLQRLSLDFFTEEKAGVLMSRMTSDIENLQQLLQDGISSFGDPG